MRLGRGERLARPRARLELTSVPRLYYLRSVALGSGTYQSLLVRDDLAEAAAVKVETGKAGRGDVLTVDLRAGGGFIARLSP